ncbi:MAG: S-formylglutathione hydrolase [Casimicrobiaceae bacterium]
MSEATRVPKRVTRNRMFGGMQDVYTHFSTSTRSPMRFALYLPPQAAGARVPALMWLSGLTCNEENFTFKAGAQRAAARLGLALIVPDTSPRGLAIPGVRDASDFGEGASFYVDATVAPWVEHYRMYSYVSAELPDLVAAHFQVDTARMGICGHSMGGHGALVVALRNPERFASVSAFAPITSPMHTPWGDKAFSGYLGSDRAAWRDYDATELIASRGWRGPPLRIEQGDADPFLASQLKPQLFAAACADAGVALDLRQREGYDHSYYFIATFIDEHLRMHADVLDDNRRA